MRKPTVYIASPYSEGDLDLNVRFQCQVFDQLLSDARVLPIAPLWSHFQNMMLPRPRADWMQYSTSILVLYDCCLRLTAKIPALSYTQFESIGADLEVEAFEAQGKPVFHSIDDLYVWVKSIAQR